MNKFKTWIIDDEAPARRLLCKYVLETPVLDLLGEATNPLDFLEKDGLLNCDLILLDIKMPEQSGLDFLRTLPKPPTIILVTAFEEFALDGFELNVCDYLIKPVSYSRFLKAISKISAESVVNNVNELSNIFIKEGAKLVRKEISDILFAESFGEFVKLHFDSEVKLVRKTLDRIETDLGSSFIRIHRKYVVNVEKVISIEGYNVKLESHTIPLSKARKELFIRKLGKDRIW
jgi:DNA-binding LytR/AlgR family response regulator